MRDPAADVIAAEFRSRLTVRERIILDMLYAGHTQAEIGQRLGITRQRVSQLVAMMKQTYKVARI